RSGRNKRNCVDGAKRKRNSAGARRVRQRKRACSNKRKHVSERSARVSESESRRTRVDEARRLTFLKKCSTPTPSSACRKTPARKPLEWHISKPGRSTTWTMCLTWASSCRETTSRELGPADGLISCSRHEV